jgi:hypothetical protein
MCTARLRAQCMRFHNHSMPHHNAIDGDWIDPDPSQAKTLQDVLHVLVAEALDDDIAAATFTAIRSGLPIETALCEAIKLWAKTRRRQYKMLTCAAEILPIQQWAQIIEAGDKK